MKNVKSANFLLVDHKVKMFSARKGNVVLPSPQAWKNFSWTRKWFKTEPKEGYFFWLKKETDSPLFICVFAATPKISQNLNNLLVVEKGIEAKANVLCQAEEKNLCVRHNVKGKIILKPGASLEYYHSHEWGEGDFVSPDYQVILEKGSKFLHVYKNLQPPKELKIKTEIFSQAESSANLTFLISGENSKTEIKDGLFLEGSGCQGIVRLRLVGRKNSFFEAESLISARAPSKGHLDCQGLLVDKDSKISLTPRLISENKEAQLTHEASIGKVSEEQLVYLRMRGLTEKEAIDLIVAGFLGG